MALARVRGPGHPDRVCDLVAASIVEEYLRRDPASQLNVRVAGGHGVLFVAGEVQSAADFDVSAVVKRVVASCGVRTPMEPFIAFEPMPPAWAPTVGSREIVHVFGYASTETQSLLPNAAHLAHEAAQDLEFRRTNDPEWFWLGSDYEVVADDVLSKPSLTIRAEHLDQPLAAVRERIISLLQSRFPGVDVRVNEAGEEPQTGWGMRMGSSGQASSMDQYGSLLPANTSGVGRQLSHPQNAGVWIARSLARSLVRAGRGKAVVVHATWSPLEAKPSSLKIRNETGLDLTKLIDPLLVDLARLPDAYRAPHLGLSSVRTSFDRGLIVPWET